MELLNKLRERVNESNFIYLKYSNDNEKNKWNCICSAMDWIQVGVATIRAEDVYNGDNLIKCMNFYRYISAIDVACESIYQLHRVFIGNNTLPFKGDKSIFGETVLNTEDDDDFFKEIRASFGAHSPNLYIGEGEGKRRFSSWSISGRLIGEKNDWNVLLYSNQPNERDIKLGVNISDLKLYFEKRYNYIENIIQRINFLELEFIGKMKNTKIDFSGCKSPLEQLCVLEKENKNRFGDNTFNDLIDSMKLFFNTTFIEKSNEKDIAYFEGKLYAGIEEIKNALQNMENDTHLEISNLLNPKYRPNIHMYLYEFANLYSCVFTKNRKLYMKETLIEPLKGYITFNYMTEEELYFLIIIALNKAVTENYE